MLGLHPEDRHTSLRSYKTMPRCRCTGVSEPGQLQTNCSLWGCPVLPPRGASDCPEEPTMGGHQHPLGSPQRGGSPGSDPIIGLSNQHSQTRCHQQGADTFAMLPLLPTNSPPHGEQRPRRAPQAWLEPQSRKTPPTTHQQQPDLRLVPSPHLQPCRLGSKIKLTLKTNKK